MPLATCQGHVPHYQSSMPHQDTSWLPVKAHLRSRQGLPCCSIPYTWWARTMRVSSSQHSCAMCTHCTCTYTDCHSNECCCTGQAICILVRSSHHCSSNPSKTVFYTKTCQANTSRTNACFTTQTLWMHHHTTQAPDHWVVMPRLPCLTWITHWLWYCYYFMRTTVMMCHTSTLITRRQLWSCVMPAHGHPW